MATPPHYILVTGATGFIGAHVVDVLLSRGLRVRGATRSLAKGHLMMQSRPQYASKLDFVQVPDFAEGGDFSEAVKDVDAVVHVASPFSYDTKDNEKELILPAIAGVKAILAAAASNPNITRLVLTSSFASVMDANRSAPPYFTYTGNDWNPLTYAEAAAPSAPAFLASRVSKLFAERAAWDFVAARNPAFSLVTLCPPMTFGPVVHPVASVDKLNESNAVLWRIAGGESPLPVARVPFWIDVRDLALAHVEALLRPGVGGQRFVPAASERFSYGRAASIMVDEFDWAKSKVQVEAQAIDESHGLDGQTAAEVLGLEYRSFKQTVVDLVRQAYEMDAKARFSRTCNDETLFLSSANDEMLKKSTHYCRQILNQFTRLVDALTIDVAAARGFSRRTKAKLMVVLSKSTLAQYEQRMRDAILILIAAQSFCTQ
ncbi:hypothetical protein VdG1_06330 [Verticillium dahliae VDG1]|nr:hypothetical protein VdG1_06330 [Verticillium dahliae VDG1]